MMAIEFKSLTIEYDCERLRFAIEIVVGLVQILMHSTCSLRHKRSVISALQFCFLYVAVGTLEFNSISRPRLII
jgi:hypothetical protein